MYVVVSNVSATKYWNAMANPFVFVLASSFEVYALFLILNQELCMYVSSMLVRAEGTNDLLTHFGRRTSKQHTKKSSKSGYAC